MLKRFEANPTLLIRGAPVKLVLDTNVLIGGYSVPDDARAAVTSISYAELEAGIWRSTDPIVQALRQVQLGHWRRTFGPGLVFDDAAASSFGLLMRVSFAAGRPSPRRTLDLMIAATAHAHGAGILTHNVKDFAAVERLVPVVSV